MAKAGRSMRLDCDWPSFESATIFLFFPVAALTLADRWATVGLKREKSSALYITGDSS